MSVKEFRQQNPLQTEKLIWDKNQDLIYTDSEVKIQTDDEIITGIGFKSTPDFKDYEITKDPLV